MAHDLDIRFRCRAHYEMYGKNLKEINEIESVAVSTLSEWKNDGRKEYGGLWILSSRKDEIGKAAKMLQDEIVETQAYKELKANLNKRHGVTATGEIEFNSGIQLKATPQEIQVKIEADTIMLGALGIDYFNNALINNAILSQNVLQNQVTKDITKVRQADIKASSEIIKIAKEARYGKDPDTVNHFSFQIGKYDYTDEELKGMDIADIEKVLHNLEKKVLEGNIIEHKEEVEKEDS